MLKIGLIGLGGISKAHIAAWQRIPEARLTCVCDLRAQMVNEAAAETGARGYENLDEMLKSEDFDVLDICLPTYLHTETALQALKAGRHVLLEKPVSLERADVRRLYEAAAASGRNLMVAYVLRFWREYEILKEIVDSGRCGRLLSGSMTRLNRTPHWSWNNWMQDARRSGQVLFDLHIHDLDFMVYAFGAPQGFAAHRAKTAEQDRLSVAYEYPGFYISAEAAWYACEYPFRAGFRFQFESALLEYRDNVLTLYPKNGGAQVLSTAGQGEDNGLGLPETDGFYREIRYFADCLLSGTPCDRVKPAELETVLELIERLNRATL